MGTHLSATIIKGRISPQNALDLLIKERAHHGIADEYIESLLPGFQQQLLYQDFFDESDDVEIDADGNAVFDGYGISEEVTEGYVEWFFKRFITYFEPGAEFRQDENEYGDAGNLTVWDGKDHPVTHAAVWVYPAYQSAEEILIAAGFTPEVSNTETRIFTTVTEDRD